MAGFFYNLGRFLGQQGRKARWVLSSATGTAADAHQAEAAVGRDAAAALLREVPADPDPAVARWLDEVGGLLAAAVPPPAPVFTFRSLLLPLPNAFALPGGYVFATRSLLRLCQQSHDDLAFVLGHEMAHIVRGHALERLTAGSLLSPVGRLMPGPIGALVTTLLHRGYSQDQELEADEHGARLAGRAGFDAAAGVRLLRTLRFQLAGPEGLMGYFATHPPWEVRIERLAARIG